MRDLPHYKTVRILSQSIILRPTGERPVAPLGLRALWSKPFLDLCRLKVGTGMLSKNPFRVVEIDADGSRHVVASELSLDGAEWVAQILLAMDPGRQVSIETQLSVTPGGPTPHRPPAGAPTRPST